MDGSGRMRAGCIRIRCPSPRRAMSRLLTSKGKIKAKKKKDMEESRVRDYDSVRIRNLSEADQFADSPPRTIDPELQGREFLFSIGVSCYLLHLIATGREEIHKIVDLRNDLEKLLECQNDETRRKHQEFIKIRDNIEKLLEFHNDELSRKQQESPFGQQEQFEVVDGPESSTDHYHYSPHLLESSFSVGREGSLKHYVFKEGEEEHFGGEMDQLEAELEAEFKLLQIGQEQESGYSKLTEVSGKSGDSEVSSFRYMSSGPMEEQQGVCPYELERRLHELMETRQEEEINELQSALEDAKKRLNVKEAEASWWKDTAYIVSEHIPKPSRITSSSQTRRYPLSR